MFRKKCPKCGNKINKKDNFCPFCGFNLRKESDKEDYGFLGKSDADDFSPDFIKGPFDSMIEKMMNSAMKMLAKQMKDIQNESENNHQKKIPFNQNPNVRVQFYVNGKRIDLPNPSLPISTKPPSEKKGIKIPRISKDKAEKFANLPKEEAESKMRRLSEKLVYEISVPGVRDINDILINQLENSIEIKALGRDKVYKKILPVKFPILGYGLNKGILTLELRTK